MNELDTKPFHTVQSPVEVSESRVRDLIVSAFEGGSNYWVGKIDQKYPNNLSLKDFRTGGKFSIPGDYYPGYILVPFQDGCSLEITPDDETKSYTLNAASMRRGLEMMVTKAHSHWVDFLNEDDDATTADVFLQLCLFGEIVYG